MKLLILFLFPFLSLFAHPIQKDRHAITYEPQPQHRLGNQLLLYSQARYLSYMTEIPFLFRPFPAGEHLQIDYEALPYEPTHQNIHRIDSAKSLSTFFRLVRDPALPPTLFVVDYFPADISEWDNNNSLSLLFNIPWQNKAFKTYLQQSIVPRIQVPNLRESGVLNVAIHIRSNSASPLKAPAISYHKRQIKKVYDLSKQQSMYVHLFTDAKNSRELCDELKRHFKDTNIVFNTNRRLSATEDFFAMQQFDVLIATQSNFSMMAWRMGDFDMVFFPIHHKSGDKSEVDRIQMITQKSDWFPYEFNVILKEDF